MTPQEAALMHGNSVAMLPQMAAATYPGYAMPNDLSSSHLGGKYVLPTTQSPLTYGTQLEDWNEQRKSKDFRERFPGGKYSLSMAQEPVKCKSNKQKVDKVKERNLRTEGMKDQDDAATKKRDKPVRGNFLIEPTPIVEVECKSDKMEFFINSPYWTMRVDLVQLVNNYYELREGLTGQVWCSPERFKCPHGHRNRLMFAFRDLEVEPEGTFRLRFTLYEQIKSEVGNQLVSQDRPLQMNTLAVTFSDEFQVLKPNSTTRPVPSNSLCQQMNEAGIKTRPNKKARQEKIGKAQRYAIPTTSIQQVYGNFQPPGSFGHAGEFKPPAVSMPMNPFQSDVTGPIDPNLQQMLFPTDKATAAADYISPPKSQDSPAGNFNANYEANSQPGYDVNFQQSYEADYDANYANYNPDHNPDYDPYIQSGPPQYYYQPGI